MMNRCSALFFSCFKSKKDVSQDQDDVQVKQPLLVQVETPNVNLASAIKLDVDYFIKTEGKSQLLNTSQKPKQNFTALYAEMRDTAITTNNLRQQLSSLPVDALSKRQALQEQIERAQSTSVDTEAKITKWQRGELNNIDSSFDERSEWTMVMKR